MNAPLYPVGWLIVDAPQDIANADESSSNCGALLSSRMSTEPNSQQTAILQSPNKVKLIDAVAGAGKTTTLAMEARHACAGGLPERAVLALCFSRGARLRFHEKLKEEAGEHSAIFVMTVEDFARQLIEDLAEKGRITRPVAHSDVEGIRGELVAAAGRVWQRYQEQG